MKSVKSARPSAPLATAAGMHLGPDGLPLYVQHPLLRLDARTQAHAHSHAPTHARGGYKGNAAGLPAASPLLRPSHPTRTAPPHAHRSSRRCSWATCARASRRSCPRCARGPPLRRCMRTRGPALHTLAPSTVMGPGPPQECCNLAARSWAEARDWMRPQFDLSFKSFNQLRSYNLNIPYRSRRSTATWPRTAGRRIPGRARRRARWRTCCAAGSRTARRWPCRRAWTPSSRSRCAVEEGVVVCVVVGRVWGGARGPRWRGGALPGAPHMDVRLTLTRPFLPPNSPPPPPRHTRTPTRTHTPHTHAHTLRTHARGRARTR
jgi:hypothetical protein